MIFAILILGSPPSSQASKTALRFARAALRQGHPIYRIFFFDDGVNVANNLAVTAQDETDIGAQWSALAAEHNLDLVVCVSSALKRGIINDSEASRHEKGAANLLPHFEISGLGQWLDATLHADRVITFGA